MGDRSSIEWTEATWNPLIGCRRVSDGCRFCYAERQAIRIDKYKGIVQPTANGPRWTGASRLVTSVIDQPLRWKRPRRIFVDSMADLFFEGHSNEDIAAVFGVMTACPQHTFQVLTKRPERAREWFAWVSRHGKTATAKAVCSAAAWAAVKSLVFKGAFGRRFSGADLIPAVSGDFPLSNVWIGCSVENQETADERIPLLLETPAAVRFVSYEPALGPVDFHPFLCAACGPGYGEPEPTLDWIIAGSESGPRARPADLEWFRSVRAQCEAAGVAYFFKQWVGDVGCDLGVEEHGNASTNRRKVSLPILDGRQHAEFPR